MEAKDKELNVNRIKIHINTRSTRTNLLNKFMTITRAKKGKYPIFNGPFYSF